MQPFVYLASCGCVFSQAGLKAVSGPTPSKSPTAGADSSPDKAQDKGPALDLCPNCGAKYDRTADVLTLNPAPELEASMRAAMEVRRALEPAKTKGKGKKRKAAAAAAAGEDTEPPAKKHIGGAAPSTNPSISAASRAVTQELAKEEARRKAGMSDAVKSLYAPKDGTGKKETFMTMGTFTRVRLSVALCRELPLLIWFCFLYSMRERAVPVLLLDVFSRIYLCIVVIAVCTCNHIITFIIRSSMMVLHLRNDNSSGISTSPQPTNSTRSPGPRQAVLVSSSPITPPLVDPRIDRIGRRIEFSVIDPYRVPSRSCSVLLCSIPAVH